MTEEPKVPRFAPEHPRYAGKPFDLVVEYYVLDAIGQVTDEARAALTKLEPMLHDALGRQGTWKEIVAAELRLPDTVPAAIRRVWQGYLDHHHKHSQSVDPHEFAQEFIDTNFGGKD